MRLDRREDWLRVCVADNGRGIPAADLDLVFEKFRQAASGGEKPIGTGLWLPISRQIVENFGGRIWAQAGALTGATLCFELPELACDPCRETKNSAPASHIQVEPSGQDRTDPAPPPGESPP